MSSKKTAATPEDKNNGNVEHFPQTKNLNYIKITSLNVDKTYQREDYSKNLAREIAKDFDADCFGVLIVVKRKCKKYYVVDGQTRLIGAAQRGLVDVPCVVTDLSTLSLKASRMKEANMWKSHNRDSRKASAYAKFHIECFTLEEDALAVQEICNNLGYKIPRSHRVSWPWVNCIGTVRDIYKNHGANITKRTLFLIRETWAGDAEALNLNLVKGTSELILLDSSVTNEEFIREFRSHEPKKLHETLEAATGFTRGIAMAKKLADKLNRNRKKKDKIDIEFLIRQMRSKKARVNLQKSIDLKPTNKKSKQK